MEIWGEPMEVCFSKLRQRVLEAVETTDLDPLFRTFEKINGPTAVTGVGGSSVVAAFLAEVLNRKNGILCTEMMPRDLRYRNMAGYENVVACSYSGKNVGVDASFSVGLRNYLFSAGERPDAVPLRYCISEEERSFVSLAGTLIPMALTLLYYTDNDRNLLERILQCAESLPDVIPESDVVEILYGAENRAAACFLESTFTEGGLAAAVMHEKYDYCHGRCRLNDAQGNDLIWFPEDHGLDLVFRRELGSFYGRVTEIDSGYSDPVVRDFADTCTAMYLCREIARNNGKDLCLKIIPPISEVLYTYAGEL